MRIVIDLQAAQSNGSRNRGIGRYSLSLAMAMARNCGENEIIIALSGLFPETIKFISEKFDDLLPQKNIRIWNAIPPLSNIDGTTNWRRSSAELVREAFIASLKPDILHVSSLFESFADNSITSIGRLPRLFPTAVTLYDLIPYIYRKIYLTDPIVERWYLEKIEYLRRADLWLAISESSRREGIDQLGLPEDQVINVSADADSRFKPINVSVDYEQTLRQRYGLHHPFVMYTGGIDHRKNVEGLIRAYAMMPVSLRANHQLAIVCNMQPENRSILKQLASQHGLDKNELVLTGFAPDDDLIALYNLCALFVFPSWHEGFGLPALEAMRCGAPVIGANTSSLPEVIGCSEALFDPHNEAEIAHSIERTLIDDNFRKRLVEHGFEHAKNFSWNTSARRVFAAMERLYESCQNRRKHSKVIQDRPKLAYVSPMPPERSGIADYSSELLPELARYYEIDVIVRQNTVSDGWINANCPVRSVRWFIEHVKYYDRVLYHFGNCIFHKHMFNVLNKIPGVVVLHDFFLSGIVAHIDIKENVKGYWGHELYLSHGYDALAERFHANDMDDVIWKYPCSLSVIQDSLGIIVHSPNSIRLAEQWYGGELDEWAVIPLLRNSTIIEDKQQARKAIGFGTTDFLVCAFGMIGPIKLNHRLLQAWLQSELSTKSYCHLLFVGEKHWGDYGRDLLSTIRSSKMKNVHITGWVDGDTYRHYLSAADIGVQLRTYSRGETSAAVLDCMNHGLATIVNANGSMANLDETAVWKLPDEFSDEQLVEALEALWQDESLRCRMGELARSIILQDHSPKICADQYYGAIERFYQTSDSGLPGLISSIAAIESTIPSVAELIHLADNLSHNFLPRNRKRQLLVDISELVQHGVKNGVQRAARCIIMEWLSHPQEGFRVEPVYADVYQQYRYARRFTLESLGCPIDVLRDEPIEYAYGDLFVCLDLQPQLVVTHRTFYQTLRRYGVQVKFVVYDLTCLLMPQYFIPGEVQRLFSFLEVVNESDGAVCTSKVLAEQLTNWVKENKTLPDRQLRIDSFYLGADIGCSAPTKELSSHANSLLDKLRSRISFLMVGTLEPRKGYAQVLKAFNQLWQSGADINLVIVGKQGQMVESLLGHLNSHSELNNRLFWIDGISDEYLEKVYMDSSCLIAASYGEGFNLPIIESGRYNLPIIARDIPIYRELAGDYALFFSNDNSPDAIIRVIREWLVLHNNDTYAKSECMHMHWPTWEESARNLLYIIQNDK